MLHLPRVLDPERVAALRTLALRAPWVDGRVTAGGGAVQAKRNQQIEEASAEGRDIADAVMQALERYPAFAAAAFPARVSRALVNRYGAGMEYGSHVDNPLMGGTRPLRTDLSATLFLSDPGEYDGGELVVDELVGTQAVKLPAGDLFLYNATRVHRVNPVTRGARLAAVFWVQSMVADPEQRTLLFEMSQALAALEYRHGASPEIARLAACHARLVHRWVQP